MFFGTFFGIDLVVNFDAPGTYLKRLFVYFASDQ